MTAASRSHGTVIHFLTSVASIDLLVRNLQNESVYDIAAEKGDLITCNLVESIERRQWAETNPNGIFPLISSLADAFLLQSDIIRLPYTASSLALSWNMHVSIFAPVCLIQEL